MTGIPPPPQAITITSFKTNSLITFFSKISIGLGDGTTLLYPLPASSTKIKPFSLAILSASSLL